MKKEYLMAIYLLIASLVVGFVLTYPEIGTVSMNAGGYGAITGSIIGGAVVPLLINAFIFGGLRSLHKKGQVKNLYTVSVAITAVVFVVLSFAL